jgi:hypothetical protein
MAIQEKFWRVANWFLKEPLIGSYLCL